MAVRIIQGDALSVLKTLLDESVHCCVTSPPYWGLRDYGIPPSIWGVDPACDHEWEDASWRANRCGAKDDDTPGEKQRTNDGSLGHRGETKEQHTCRHCGAWRGCFGLEPTPALYVEHAVMVFREVRRVLRDDATLWLNLGDSYNAYNGNAGPGSGFSSGAACDTERPKLKSGHGLRTNSLKPKDLVGIPWRVAFALQADGWYLRQDIIWAKPNPMPESVRDRCTKSHEYLFLLAKSERYYFDADAIAEPEMMKPQRRLTSVLDDPCNKVHDRPEYRRAEGSTGGGTRNKRSVWTVATQPYKEAHFATFPPALIEPCILAGCPGWCCQSCGAPWERLTERAEPPSVEARDKRMPDSDYERSRLIGGQYQKWLNENPKVTVGFAPSCACEPGPTIAGTVLDPFGGACTTGLVADRLQRNAILIELNPAYVSMGERRIQQDGPLFAEVTV